MADRKPSRSEQLRAIADGLNRAWHQKHALTFRNCVHEIRAIADELAVKPKPKAKKAA